MSIRRKSDTKGEFLDVFRRFLGNVSAACKSFKIDRKTFYNWCNEDADFAKACEEIREERKDFIESALDKKIREGDTAAIIFAAKTLCKDRGYTEKNETDVNLQAAQPISITFHEVKAKPTK